MFYYIVLMMEVRHALLYKKQQSVANTELDCSSFSKVFCVSLECIKQFLVFKVIWHIYF